MRDAEARERIENLEQALANLPQRITEAVLESLAPADVEALDARLTAVVAKLDEVAAALARAESGELLEVLESEVNALRVDVNAQRETTAALADSVANTEVRITRVVAGFAQIGRDA